MDFSKTYTFIISFGAGSEPGHLNQAYDKWDEPAPSLHLWTHLVLCHLSQGI